jgi:hypothetical protein
MQDTWLFAFLIEDECIQQSVFRFEFLIVLRGPIMDFPQRPPKRLAALIPCAENSLRKVPIKKRATFRRPQPPPNQFYKSIPSTLLVFRGLFET